MMKLKIITAFDHNFQKIGSKSALSIKTYADKYGFDFHIYDDVGFGRPPSWAKIPYLLGEMEDSSHDYILWVDADAVFVRSDENILESIDKSKSIFIVNQICGLGTVKGSPGVYIYVERPNCGIILVKNCPWSRSFLERVWKQEQFIYSGWWEQSAFHYLMGYHFEISNCKFPNKPNKEVMSNIGWLESKWNCVPTLIDETIRVPLTNNSIRHMIIHFAGLDNVVRENQMTQAIKELEQNIRQTETDACYLAVKGGSKLHNFSLPLISISTVIFTKLVENPLRLLYVLKKLYSIIKAGAKGKKAGTS